MVRDSGPVPGGGLRYSLRIWTWLEIRPRTWTWLDILPLYQGMVRGRGLYQNVEVQALYLGLVRDTIPVPEHGWSYRSCTTIYVVLDTYPVRGLGRDTGRGRGTAGAHGGERGWETAASTELQ